MQDSSIIYRKNDNFVFRKIEGETILVPIKDNVADMGSLYNLNDVGAFVWELIDGQRNLQAIKRKIVKEYEVSDQQAENDLIDYISQLKEIDAVISTE